MVSAVRIPPAGTAEAKPSHPGLSVSSTGKGGCRQLGKKTNGEEAGYNKLFNFLGIYDKNYSEILIKREAPEMD